MTNQATEAKRAKRCQRLTCILTAPWCQPDAKTSVSRGPSSLEPILFGKSRD